MYFVSARPANFLPFSTNLKIQSNPGCEGRYFRTFSPYNVLYGRDKIVREQERGENPGFF